MTNAEEEVKKYRQDIDQAKGFIKQYGWGPAMLHTMTFQDGNRDKGVWLVALTEWNMEQKSSGHQV